MTISIVQGDSKIMAGTWTAVICDGKPTSYVACPGCGARAGLHDHQIAEDGQVTPSMVCPKSCGFHEMVKLHDWKPDTSLA